MTGCLIWGMKCLDYCERNMFRSVRIFASPKGLLWIMRFVRLSAPLVMKNERCILIECVVDLLSRVLFGFPSVNMACDKRYGTSKCAS